MPLYRIAAVLALFGGLGVFAVAAIAQTPPPDTVAKSDPRTPAEERKAFHVPEGFEVQLVASDPDIHKPMNIAFDDQGRLWVTETIEYPFPVGPGKTGRDGVKILSDFGPDGHARKIETFTDGLNIPIGLLPMPTEPNGQVSALVYSIPQILKISDDGETREPLYSTYGYRDTHGMTNAFTWGFDGWVYATHGYSNQSTVQGADKKPITMQSGNTYRMRPDGSHLEYYCHGQVNPFGLAFDPLGYLYSSDCHSRPVYQLLRGAWYPSFGTKDDGIGLGPEMATHDHGSTGIAGIVYYAADDFPKTFRDNLFVGNVVTNRINRDTIEWHGSTPKAIEQPDFLVSDDPWFRPVDLKLGPDGAMYVADFYNRIIGHYEVPLTHPGRDRERGRIWRIVYRGKNQDAKTPSMPRLVSSSLLNISTLKTMLGSPNLTVRSLAANRLTTVRDLHPNSMNDLLGNDGSREQKVSALWILYRKQAELDRKPGPHFRESEKQRLSRVTDLRKLPAEVIDRLDEEEKNPVPLTYLTKEILSKTAHDADGTVRVHTMRILGERSELAGRFAELAREAVKDSDPHVRRAAADALGRHPDTSNIKPLIALRGSTPADDTHLIHVARMALRDQFLEDSAWEWLNKQPLTEAEEAGIADIATGVPSAASARFLLAHIKKRPESPANLARFVHHVARYGDVGEKPELLVFLKGSKTGKILGQVELLKAYQQGMQERGGQLSVEDRQFALELTTTLLDSSHENEVIAGIGQASQFRLEGVRDRLTALGANPKSPEAQRGEALAALSAIDPKAAAPILGKMLADASAPFGLRERATALLASGNQPEGQAELLKAIPTAPERLQNAIGAGLAVRRAGGEALLDAIGAGKASARLLQDNRIAGLLANAHVPDLANRVAVLLKGQAPADARLNGLIAKRRESFARAKADGSLGAKVFETHCAACHQIGGKGSKIGPQLDGVGVRGLDRMLEDVLDPSRNVDQTFRTTTLALKDGRVVSGLLLSDAGEVLVLADNQGKEVRISKDTIEERSMSPLSPMPANFSEQIPEADFQRLMAYLLKQRPAD